MKRAVATLLLACAGCGAPAAPVEAPGDDEPPPRYAVALRFEEEAPSAEGTPRTRVSLVRITPEGERTVRALRTEDGACYHRPAPGALIAGVCWWAGAGARYVVRRDGDAILALRADANEEGGYGDLAELARLDVPADAELDLLGAR